MMVAYVPIGLLWGTLAAGKGFSALEAMLMSIFVYAGASQFVAVDMWREPVPLVLLIATTLVVNLRHVLMSASLSRHIGTVPPERPCRYGLEEVAHRLQAQRLIYIALVVEWTGFARQSVLRSALRTGHEADVTRIWRKPASAGERMAVSGTRD